MADIVITGGLVVTPNGADNLDVFIAGESISAVAAPGMMDHGDARVIDAAGKIVAHYLIITSINCCLSFPFGHRSF